MKAVILAAGKSTRSYPFTLTRPKALLRILDKTLLEHTFDQLKGIVDEIIIVVGYMKEKIIEKFGKEYNGMKLTFVEQKEQNGTGGALLCAKDFLKGKFIVLNGDDIYSAKDIKECVKHDYSIMGMEIDDPEKWGIIEVKDEKVIGFEEKPSAEDAKSNIGNAGLYVLDEEIFKYELPKTERGEYEIVDYIKHLIKDGKEVKCHTVSDYWLPVGYPWHYLEANVFFLRRMKETVIKGTVEEGVTIKGIVFIGEGTLIKSGTYIEGPAYIGKNCEIGPHCFIRKDSILFDGVRTRAEIIDSVIMDNTTAKHNSYIGHSVIGENCNIAAGTITADYRHDGKNNKTLIQGKKLCSGRRKLGAFLGDNVTTGIGTLIYPGRKIWPGKGTLPGSIVKEDVM